MSFIVAIDGPAGTGKGTMAELTGESWCKREHFRGMGFRLRT